MLSPPELLHQQADDARAGTRGANRDKIVFRASGGDSDRKTNRPFSSASLVQYAIGSPNAALLVGMLKSNGRRMEVVVTGHRQKLNLFSIRKCDWIGSAIRPIFRAGQWAIWIIKYPLCDLVQGFPHSGRLGSSISTKQERCEVRRLHGSFPRSCKNSYQKSYPVICPLACPVRPSSVGTPHRAPFGYRLVPLPT